MKLHLKKVKVFYLLIIASGLLACKQANQSELNGTWKLISSEVITNGVTKKTFPVKDQEMIKMFNDTHFSFFKHDVHHGKNSAPVFDSGSGTYTLEGKVYKEHLTYCNYRNWENHAFTFDLTIKKDTLIQRGIEKIDSLKINQEIVEIYVRIKK